MKNLEPNTTLEMYHIIDYKESDDDCEAVKKYFRSQQQTFSENIMMTENFGQSSTSSYEPNIQKSPDRPSSPMDFEISDNFPAQTVQKPEIVYISDDESETNISTPSPCVSELESE